MRPGVRTARVVGLALGVAVAVARRWRPRPLHPSGVVLAGALHVESHGAPGGAALGAPVAHPVVVRVSRAAGLPAPLPDVFGLAVHWTTGGRSQDLLLSATGLGRATRFLLAPRVRPCGGGFGTLMPFRDVDDRPVLLAAAPAGPSPRDLGATSREPVALVGVELRLLSAHPGGRWHRLGALRCGEIVTADAPRVDPVQNVPGALGTYPWAAALRAPAYRAARGGQPPGYAGGAA
ncbi:hypothetical protein [Myceligenerans pegani]|uniref:Phosphodiesterase n=1 Tax=Myceligenerans pegani TaxID=2776917 RepID=A0ABR9N1H5_9MICO|nr:hypothetical protein [Myceligenerans sp. TRM 65318]MBE1877489.1 hypothetical protein [Myceligenerans sp. TRM 65318]MBE3019760.1 hypothetical protein [Myceligenerans sp. TRM 65318]